MKKEQTLELKGIFRELTRQKKDLRWVNKSKN